MSILIKGVDMSPDRIQGITVFPEGFAVVEEYYMLAPIKTTKCEIAPVPTPHGRLIDADALNYEYYKSPSYLNLCNAINAAPTIIEAEEGEG